MEGSTSKCDHPGVSARNQIRQHEAVCGRGLLSARERLIHRLSPKTSFRISELRVAISTFKAMARHSSCLPNAKTRIVHIYPVKQTTLIGVIPRKFLLLGCAGLTTCEVSREHAGNRATLRRYGPPRTLPSSGGATSRPQQSHLASRIYEYTGLR
jgi:hypothetical protein